MHITFGLIYFLEYILEAYSYVCMGVFATLPLVMVKNKSDLIFPQEVAAEQSWIITKSECIQYGIILKINRKEPTLQNNRDPLVYRK